MKTDEYLKVLEQEAYEKNSFCKLYDYLLKKWCIDKKNLDALLKLAHFCADLLWSWECLVDNKIDLTADGLIKNKVEVSLDETYEYGMKAFSDNTIFLSVY